MRTVSVGCLLFGVLLTGCAGKQGYAQWNIHYNLARNQGNCASWTEFTGHRVVPMNTEVRIRPSWRRRSRIIVSTVEPPRRTITLFYKPLHVSMSRQEFIDRLVDSEPKDTSQMLPVDQRGIKDGKAYMGMTKEGVMLALGYPSLYVTVSMEKNEWVYYRNRFSRRRILFDADGKVSELIPPYK